MKRLGFDIYFDEAPLFLKVAEYLSKSYSVEVSGVTLGNRWGKLIAKHNIKTMNISDFLDKNWDRIETSFDFLLQLENKYNIPNLSSFILADRFLSNLSYEKALKYLVGHFLFFEKYFTEVRPDVYIGPGVAFLSHLVSFTVANRLNIPHLSLVTIRSNQSRFVAFSNYKDSWDSVNSAYSKLKERKLTEDEKMYAENYLDEFRNKREKPIYMNFARQSLNLRKEFIVEFMIRLRRYYHDGWKNCKFDYITQNPFWYVWRDGIKLLRSKAFSLAKIFDDIELDVPFFFFPLHLQPEASTLILSSFYVNQIATIENIAKTLPAGSKLYVKEHISSFGRRHLSYYKAIKKVSNVRLISPFESSHELINKAIASIVLSSTVGWESILYEKPVISLGNAFYNASGLTFMADHYTALPDIINNDVINYKPDRENLLKFIVALREGSYPGLFDVPHMHSDNKVMSQNNVIDLSKGIMQSVKLIKDTECLH